MSRFPFAGIDIKSFAIMTFEKGSLKQSKEYNKVDVSLPFPCFLTVFVSIDTKASNAMWRVGVEEAHIVSHRDHEGLLISSSWSR